MLLQKYTIAICLFGVNYEPGSTFKIITLAAALEEGKVDLEKDHFHDPGSVRLVVQGCDVGKEAVMGVNLFLRLFKIPVTRVLLNLEKDLEKKRLFKYVKDFGFGKKRELILQGEGTGYSI